MKKNSNKIKMSEGIISKNQSWAKRNEHININKKE